MKQCVRVVINLAVFSLQLKSASLNLLNLLKNSGNDESCQDDSKDVENLFTSISVQEMIEYLLHRIYICKEIKTFKINIQKVFSIDREMELSSRKVKKNSYISGGNFRNPRNKNFLYF